MTIFREKGLFNSHSLNYHCICELETSQLTLIPSRRIAGSTWIVGVIKWRLYSRQTSCFASKSQYRDKGAIQEISTVYLGTT